MGKPIDLIGNIYGQLTVIGSTRVRGARGWLCQCTCGNQVRTSTDSLHSGNTKSCGCTRRGDETGKRYGRLTVIRYVEDERPGAYWLCHCDCGKDIVTRGGGLRYGSSQSCGCVAAEKLRAAVMLPDGEAARNYIIGRTQRQARDRDYEYTLTRDELINLMGQHCHYCGGSASNLNQHPELNGTFAYNGIDRVDNSKGYILENVVPCCKHCNYAKRDRTQDEFLAWVSQVYNHSIHGDKEI